MNTLYFSVILWKNAVQRSAGYKLYSNFWCYLTNYLTSIFTVFVSYYCYCYCYCYLMLLLLQFFVRTTVVVHKSSSLLRSSVIMKGKVTNNLKPPLIKTWSAFNTCLVFCVWSLRKVNYDLFSVKFSVKIGR